MAHHLTEALSCEPFDNFEVENVYAHFDRKGPHICRLMNFVHGGTGTRVGIGVGIYTIKTCWKSFLHS